MTRTATRTRRTTSPEPEDNRDRHPLFDQYRAQWAGEVAANPILSRLSTAAQASYARQMARSSVRFDETVTHRDR